MQEYFSNCCGTPMNEDHSFCPECHEHTVPITEEEMESEEGKTLCEENDRQEVDTQTEFGKVKVSDTNESEIL